MGPSKTAPTTLTRKAVIGTGWSAAAMAGRQLLSVVFVGILGRLLGPEAYGVVGMAAIVTNFLINFRDLGTGAAIIQRKEVSGRFLSTLFWMNMTLGATLTLIAIVSSWPAAAFFSQPRVASVLQVLGFSFFIASLGIVPDSLLRRESLFQYLAVSDLAGAIFGYAIGVTCAFRGLGVWSLVIASLTGVVVSTSLNFRFARWHPKLTFDWGDLRSVRAFSTHLTVFAVFNYIARNADNLIVGRVLGTGPLGQYQMAYSLMMFPLQNISSVIAQAQFPSFARIQDDLPRFRDAWLRSCRLVSLITFPVVAGLAVVADPLVRTMLGPKWIPVVGLFRILAPVGMIQSVVGLVGIVHVARGRTGIAVWIGLMAAVVTLTAFLIGVHWGVTGVATAYLIASLIIAPVSFLIALHRIKLPVATAIVSLTPVFLTTMAMVVTTGAVMLLISGPAPVRLVLGVGTGVLTYFAVLRGTRPAVVSDVVTAADQLGRPSISRAVRLVFGSAA
jgi:PST family polysaccharide transporter